MAIIYKCVLVALSSKITISFGVFTLVGKSAKFKLFLQASFPVHCSNFAFASLRFLTLSIFFMLNASLKQGYLK